MHLPSAADNPLRTRHDVQRLVNTLIEPLIPWLSPGRAGMTLGSNLPWYGEPGSSLEGLMRSLWGLVPLAAGGGNFSAWALWREGIVAGTNLAHPEFWGWPQDRDQRLVESAALGFGLSLLPEESWTPLDAAARERVSTWLQRALEVRAVDNNWLFFQVLIQLGLNRCGFNGAPELVEANLLRLDEFYLGDGWYVDGAPGKTGNDGRIGDYYVPMARHLYGLIYSVAADSRDPVRAKRYRERAVRFAQDFVHWFAADGSAIPFGRSLTYRCAQGAFWGALAYAGVEALPWGVVKGLYLRHLRWWMQQPIFSETGLLTIGYVYPNLVMAESYNGPGSPYWACKVFLPLSLPENHPFWLAEEAPLPARPAVLTLPRAGLVVTTKADADDVVGLNAGQPVGDWPRHAAHKYSKFACSSRFAFSVPVGIPSLEEGGFDCTLALSEDGGRRYRSREHTAGGTVADGAACSTWQPWPDVAVTTWLIAVPVGHVRVHRLRSQRRLKTVEAGFALGYRRRDTVSETKLESGDFLLRSANAVSSVRSLGEARSVDSVELGANSHLLHSLAVMPVLRGENSPGETGLASLVMAGSELPAEPRWNFQAWPQEEGFELTRDGRVVCRCRKNELVMSGAESLRRSPTEQSSVISS